MSKAVDLFTATPKLHNCAQAVAAGAGREDLVAELASCGGGKAPDGLCGAVYAAMQLSPEACRENVRKKFVEFAGADTCFTLKMRNRTSCIRCVEKAAELVEKFGTKRFN